MHSETIWQQVAINVYLSEVEIMLEGQGDIAIDVNLLLSINVLWTHLSP